MALLRSGTYCTRCCAFYLSTQMRAKCGAHLREQQVTSRTSPPFQLASEPTSWRLCPEIAASLPRTPDGRGYVAASGVLWQYISLRRLNFSPSSFVALFMCPTCPICCAMFAFRFCFCFNCQNFPSFHTHLCRQIDWSVWRARREGFVQTQFIQGQSKTKTVRRTALPLSLFVYLCLFRHVVLSYRLSVISLVLSSCALCALITVTLSCMHIRCPMHFSYYHLIVSYMHNMCYIHVVGYSVTIC